MTQRASADTRTVEKETGAWGNVTEIFETLENDFDARGDFYFNLTKIKHSVFHRCSVFSTDVYIFGLDGTKRTLGKILNPIY